MEGTGWKREKGNEGEREVERARKWGKRKRREGRECMEGGDNYCFFPKLSLPYASVAFNHRS